MYIDYVRVYQRDDAPGIGCSLEDYPTEDYINKYELLSPCFDSRELTKKQALECLHESQPHDMEPSRVLFPAQLAIPWLLDPHAFASVLVLLFSASSLSLFPHERHDMLRSLPRVLEIHWVNLDVTAPIHLPHHHTPRPYRHSPPTTVPTTPALSHPASSSRVDFQTHAL